MQLRYAIGPRSLDALAAALDAQLPAFNAPQLTTVMQSLSRMGVDPPAPLAERLAQRAASLAKAHPGGAAKLNAAAASLGLAAA